MGIAAIPDYVGKDFTNTPPGHRFGLYFDAWDQQWKIQDFEKHDVLKRVAKLNEMTRSLINGLRIRQKALADNAGDSLWQLSAQSISPLMTGTGIEHPLENGFAFLNPYGIPYLPGSGIKGVLRRAAEELRDDISGEGIMDWTQFAIDKLFGQETEPGDTETTRNRGALTFWDVLPKCEKLAIEIMTPHYGEYYQGNSTPHDSGQPNPILFLTIPPNSIFTFFVQCDTEKLPESLRNTWQPLLETAFIHAFEWLGFGAKTAVGYGQFPRKAIEDAKIQRELENRQRYEAEAVKCAEAKFQEQLAKMSPLDRAIEAVVAASPKDQPRYKAMLSALKQGQWLGDEVRKVAEHIRDLMQQAGAWRTTSQKKKPEKDESYQATLAVLAYLEGKSS